RRRDNKYGVCIMGRLKKGIWHGPSVMEVYRVQPEKEQAVFRTTLGSVALLIYSAYGATGSDPSTRITLGMMALYVAFGAITWFAVAVRPRTSIARLTITTIVDQGMAITALALGGR